MPNIAKVLKDEITRLARKEIRVALEKTRKSSTQQQREIAKLKVQATALARQVSVLEKGLAKSAGEPPEAPPAKQQRFVPKGLVSTRKRLGISAADLAKLMGVTAQTIYNWERGATKPRPEQQEKLVSLRGVGKRRIQSLIAGQQG